MRSSDVRNCREAATLPMSGHAAAGLLLRRLGGCALVADAGTGTDRVSNVSALMSQRRAAQPGASGTLGSRAHGAGAVRAG